MTQKDNERLKHIFEKSNKIFKDNKEHVFIQSGLDYYKQLNKKDPFKRVENRAVDYLTGTRSAIWAEMLKNNHLPKYIGRALKAKIEAPFYFLGVINNVAKGESTTQAFVSSTAGFIASAATTELLGLLGPVGIGAGIVVAPEVYEIVDDGIDAVFFGDKKKQRRFSRIRTKFNNLLIKNQKSFSSASKFFSPIGKATISGIKGIGKFGKKSLISGTKGIAKAGVKLMSLLGSFFGFGGKNPAGDFPKSNILVAHSGATVPGRGEVMAILKGGETVRTEEQERAIQEALMRRYANPEGNNKKEKNSKESLLPRLSKEDDQYIIGLIADAYKRNRYGFRTLLRS